MFILKNITYYLLTLYQNQSILLSSAALVLGLMGVTGCEQPSVVTSTATDPEAFASLTPSSSAETTTPVASTICTGTKISAIDGTAICLSGAASAPASATHVLIGKEYFDSTGALVKGTMAVASSVAGANAATVITIPAGYYDGTQTATVRDTNLIAANIANGISLFGVTGNSTVESHSACTASNQTGCASNATYPTQATPTTPPAVTDVLSGKQYYVGGSQQTGTMTDRSNTWDLATAFPGTGYYSGVTSGVTLSKVCSNQNILGSAGTAACISGTTSAAAAAGDIISGNECWNSSGTKMTGTLTNRGTLDVAATFPGAGYYSASPSNAPTAANICSGTTVLGTAGTATCGGAVFGDSTASNEHRNKATTQVTLTNEATTNGASVYTNADPGYRAIPKISKDDDGWVSNGSISAEFTLVSRTNWDTACDSGTGATGGSANSVCKCGTSGTIAARITNCAAHGTMGTAATWDGSTKANAGQGVWKLVTRTAALSGTGDSAKGREVWQDQRTKLLWSSKVATSLNWCRATGSNFITNNPAKEDDPNNLCDNATYQVTGATGAAVSACFEDDGTNFTQTHGSIDSAGKGGLSRTSTPLVGWRLPTKYDYMQADIDGIRFVMPEMAAQATNAEREWSATVVGNSSGYAWSFQGAFGGWSYFSSRDEVYHVRCVGRGL